MAPTKALDLKKARLQVIIDDFDIGFNEYESIKNEITSNQLQIYFNDFQSKLNEFNDVYVEYSCLLKAEEVPGTAMSFTSFKRQIQVTLFEIKAAIMAFSTPVSEEINPAPIQQQNVRKIKMPEIKLPEFDGNYEKWIHFRDTFKSLVHENATFSTIDKFHYLKAAVKIEPTSQNLLNNYKFSEDNYEIAWEALCERYDDKRTLLIQHAVSLFQVKKAIDDSPSEIRRVIDSYQSYRCAFKQMNVSSDELNDIIFEQFVRYRLDEKSLREWDLHVQTVNPTWDELYKFLEKRSRSLTFTDKKSTSSSSTKHTTSQATKYPSKSKVLLSNEQSKFPCKLCSESHPIFVCPAYLKESVDKRNEIVMKLKLCKNCLRQGHQVKECNNTKVCKLCGLKHHSSLHRIKVNSSQIDPVQVMSQQANQNNEATEVVNSLMSTNCKSRTLITTTQTLLSTVKVLIQDVHGKWQNVRAILDSGSDENLITQETANRLGLQMKSVTKSILGINNKETSVKYEMKAIIKSKYPKHNDYVNSFKFLVFPTITGILPSFFMDTKQFKFPSEYFMADDEFNIPAKVDMLIGVKCFWDCMLMEKHTLQNNAILIHTKFGWIVSGEVQTPSQYSSSHSMISISHVYHSTRAVEDKLERFWTIEQCEPKSKLLTKEEKFCEDLYQQTTKRDESGRYIVDLPFKDNIKQLGNNLPNAIQRFKYLESRFKKDEDFYIKYKKFIDEYENLKHMREVKDVNSSLNSYYLPHHGVIKSDSTTTKLRVVFDASCKSQSGLSLNDTFNVGATVQNELYDIMIQFMTKPFAMKTDMEKMYRQVLVNKEHQPYQRIIWRDNPDQPFKHYQLETVSYGTSCAPHLATRTLIQIAQDYEKQYPEACELIRSNFYVDDCLFTCDSVNKAIELREDLCKIFKHCGMSLLKWISNDAEIMKQIPSNETDKIEESHEIKALGVMWNIRTDSFSFKLKKSESKQTTMSSVLSQIASIYDPIGWLGPVIITAKLFMKKLWSRQLKWSCKLPEDLQEEWNEFYDSLSSITSIKIQRQIMCNKPVAIQLHGFCDASISAYGIAIYARTVDEAGKIHCRLVTAKSRVAPTKQITLARLELCGLVLLASIMRRVSKILNVPDSNVYLWSDSLIVLHWIQAEPAKLSVFVGNRVAEIQEQANGFKFRHVRSNQNPADIISRGMSAYELASSKFWWYGPEFFKQPQQNWPESMLEIDTDNEEYQKEYRKVLIATQIPNNETKLIDYINERYSSPRSLINVFASILCGIDNWKRKTLKIIKDKIFRVEYIKLGEKAVIRIIQHAMFQNEIKSLSKGKSVSSTSSLKQLHPFIDDEGIVRTSGRISACKAIKEDTKHQIILPKCKFVYNLIRQIHTDNLHSTKFSTLSFVRQKYWPLHAKSLINYVVHQCVSCFKAKPIDSTQIMGELPADRINACYPFSKVSVDYAGPINLKASALRSTAVIKAYIALFKCITTKAIHLELVSDLSSAAFIASLDRFTSRRGLPTDIYSDNATCFEGTDNHFKKIAIELQPELEKYYNNKQIKWHFITPRAPHMGGLWENGIKQAKYHLKRVLTEKSLTFEEMTTILCRIEAILNSRPITPLSDNPNDIEALTPGHFLIGRPLNSKLEQDVTSIKTNRLNRWQLIQQAQQLFWKQWYDDIINNQIRPKGFQFEVNYQLNDLVLIKEANIPTMKWKLGRIIKLIIGKDGIVRNVRIKTSTGELERHVRYICKLPTDDTTIIEAPEC